MYRIIKAGKGHQFSGLYAVEKLFFKDSKCIRKEIVHEWDNRIISEAILAKLGGGEAYETFKLDNNLDDIQIEPEVTPVVARTKEEVAALTPKQLAAELKLKPEK